MRKMNHWNKHQANCWILLLANKRFIILEVKLKLVKLK